MEQVFRSSRHGGDQPPAVLFGQALGVPIGICSLPVMIAALVTMLQGGRPLPFLLYWFPLSLGVAWWWTATRLRAEIVELTVGESSASFRTRWEVATGRKSRTPSAILDVRRSGHDLLVTIGYETIVIRQTRWRDLGKIETACRGARDARVEQVRHRLDPPRRS